MSAADPDRAVGLLLAGGRGSRFDSTGHRDKLLATLEGEAVCERSARCLISVCPDSFAVLPPGKTALLQALERAGCKPLISETTRLGMGHSIAFGAARILERMGPVSIVLALADMPRLKPDTIRILIDALGSDPMAIVAPKHSGRRGHPVIFGSGHLRAMTSLGGDRGAFSILEQHPPRLIDVDDPGVLQDIDTPDDLAADPTDDSMDRRRDTPDHHR